MSQLLPCQDALDLVTRYAGSCAPPPTEAIPLAQAVDRILATDLHADRDQPPFDRSTRDGYALQTEDLGRTLNVVGLLRAGEQWSGPALQPGEAIEIMTGAPVPRGANAVLMVEHASRSGAVITPQAGRNLRSGENIVPRGAEAGQGDRVLAAGTRLGVAELALAASIGAATLQVFHQPRAAILATGDELVDVAEIPGPMQIRNSNSHGLAALVRQNGGLPQVLAPVADTREALDRAIAGVRGAGMLLLSGGVSAGKYDLVEDSLLAQGAEFYFTGVAIQPGKPAVFGRLPATPEHAEQWIFGLPGNPISTQVTAMLFAMPLLRTLGGERNAQPHFAQATLGKDVAVKPGLTRFLPARMEATLTGATVIPTGWQGSGDLHSNARANCYLVVPPSAEQLQAGQIATVLLR